jgi:hypothetical protein
MLRKFLAVLAGLFTAVALVALIESLSNRIYPPPEGMDPRNAAQLEAFVQSLPVGALAMILAAWTLGTLAGALVACWIAREKPLVFASIIGALMLAATVLNLLSIPHPDWFSITAIVLVTGAALLASRLSSTTGRRSRSL